MSIFFLCGVHVLQWTLLQDTQITDPAEPAKPIGLIEPEPSQPSEPADPTLLADVESHEPRERQYSDFEEFENDEPSEYEDVFEIDDEENTPANKARLQVVLCNFSLSQMLTLESFESDPK